LWKIPVYTVYLFFIYRDRISGYGLFQRKLLEDSRRFSTIFGFLLWKTRYFSRFSLYTVKNGKNQERRSHLLPKLNQHSVSSQSYKHYVLPDQPLTQSEGLFEDRNPFAYISTRARVAIYDDLLSAPRVIDIEPAPIMDFIESIASTTYDSSKKQGGELPYTVIREIAENFIHANFKECVVSILDNGNTIHFSDQGPGIEKKRLVLQPGVSSAVSEMKHYIRGVGSGLPIVKEYLEFKSGHLSIEDNARGGVIITLSVVPSTPLREEPLSAPVLTYENKKPQQSLATLDKRSLKVLKLFYENGMLGPSDLIDPIEVSVTTAHRILVDLEKRGLIEQAPNRKRILSSKGVAYFETSDV
jgi:hypothetical protein